MLQAIRGLDSLYLYAVEKKFSHILTHLSKIQEMENMPSNVECSSETPFTRMSITKNYNCNRHCDTDDYNYCFFIWLNQNGENLCFD